MFQARPGSQASQLLSSTLEGDESSAGNKTSKLSQGLNQKKKQIGLQIQWDSLLLPCRTWLKKINK